MLRFNRLQCGLVAGLSLFLIAGIAFSQETPTPRPGAVGSVNQADSQIAAWLIVDNQNEVALAKIALQRSENKGVKEFAETARDDHQKCISRLQKFAPQETTSPRATGPGAERPRTGTEPARPGTEQPRPGTEQPRTDQPRPGTDPLRQPGITRQPSAGLEVVSLKRELGQQCLQSAQRELEKKTNAEFDKCFMTGQVVGHQHMIDALTVFKKHASPQLQEILQDDIEMAEGHLKMAKDLFQELTGGARAKSAATSESN